MEIKEYVEEVAQKLEKELSSFGYRVKPKIMMKNNQTMRHAVMLCKDGTKVWPTIYLDDNYQQYVCGTMTVEDLVWRICHMLKRVEEKSEQYAEVTLNFEECKDKIVYRLISNRLNKEFLKEHPSIPFLDFSICFYIVMGEDHQGISSSPVTNRLLEMWKSSIHDLYRLAEKNTPRIFPPITKTISSVLVERLLNRTGEECEDFIPTKVYVLSNEQGVFGATSLLYEDLLHDFAKEMEDNLYILPSSIHELLLLPASDAQSGEFFNNLIRDVNKRCVDQEDLLSDHVYFYDREEQKFIF